MCPVWIQHQIFSVDAERGGESEDHINRNLCSSTSIFYCCLKAFTVSSSCALLPYSPGDFREVKLNALHPSASLNCQLRSSILSLVLSLWPLHTAAGCRKTSALPQSVQKSAAASCPAAAAPLFRLPPPPPLLLGREGGRLHSLLSPPPLFLLHFFLPSIPTAQTHPPLELHICLSALLFSSICHSVHRLWPTPQTNCSFWIILLDSYFEAFLVSVSAFFVQFTLISAQFPLILGQSCAV